MEKDKILTFRVEPDLMITIQQIAKIEKVSTSCLIRAALKKFTEYYVDKRTETY